MTTTAATLPAREITATWTWIGDGLDTFTDDQWAVIDAVSVALEAMQDGTASTVARKARIDSRTAYSALGWLVAQRYAHTSGNGAWTHYHPGR